MPRQARKESGTGIYHVMLRGINRQDIFEDREDYVRMLGFLQQMLEQFDESGDREVRQHLLERYGIADSIKVQELDKERRNEIIISCLELGTGLRQLSRLTGVTYGVINRINKK